MRKPVTMSVRYFLSGTAALIGLLGLAAGPAFAATFTYDGYSVTNPQDVYITASPSTLPDTGGGFEAGQIVLQDINGVAGATMDVWCLDAYHILNSSGTYTAFLPPLPVDGLPGGTPTLTGTQQGQIGALITYGDINIGSFIVSAATQLAIWAIEYGGSPWNATFVSTNPTYEAATNSLAATLLSLAETLSPSNPTATNGSIFLGFQANVYEIMQNPPSSPDTDNQGLVYIGTGTAIPQTPLPSTWTMMLAGLAGLAFVGYRRQRKGAALMAA